MADGPPGDRHGYIKISRKAYESDPFWNEAREFSRWEAWEYMIQAASFKPVKWTDGKGVVALKRGETRPLSLRHLCDEWGWSLKKVRVFLSLLHELERIETVQETAQGHTYLLVNYEVYQGQGHSEGTARAQPGHNSKAGNKGKNNSLSFFLEPSEKRGVYSEPFEELWATYDPRSPNDNKADAWSAYKARIRAGVPHDVMLEGAERYMRQVKAIGTEPRFVKHLKTFLGPGKHWTQPYPVESMQEKPSKPQGQGRYIPNTPYTKRSA